MRAPPPAAVRALCALCVGLTLFAAVQPGLAAAADTASPPGVRVEAAQLLGVASPSAAFDLTSYPALAGLRAPGAGLEPLTNERAAAVVDELIRFAESAHAGDEAALRAAAKDLALVQAEAGDRMPAELAARLKAARAKVDATIAALDEARALRLGVVARRLAEKLGSTQDAGRLEGPGAVPGQDSAVRLALSKAWLKPLPSEPGSVVPSPEGDPILPLPQPPPQPLSQAGSEHGSPLTVPAFRTLMATHTLMVLADNGFKAFLTWAFLKHVPDSASYIGWIGVIMMAPWVVGAGYAGRLADRLSKSRIIKVANVLAIPALGVSAAALTFMSVQAAVPLLLTTVFLMGVHSLVYGTAKESILKEYVPRPMISKGVGLLGTAGYAMIIAAGPLGAAILLLPASLAVAAIAGIAGLGFLVSLRLPATKPANGEHASIFATMRHLRADAPDILRTILGIGYFAFLGALAVTAVPNFGKDLLGLTELQTSLLQALAGIGVAAGAAFSGLLSNGRTVLGYVTLGALGVAGSSAVLALGWGGVPGAAAALGLLGLSAGFFGIPLHSFVQERSKPDETGRNVGLGNYVFGLSALLGSGVFALIGQLHLSPATSFTLLASLTSAVAVYLSWRFPADAVRAVVALLTKGFYRVKATGLQNIPREGSFVMGGNHVSWLDAIWVGSVTPRNVRFMMAASLTARIRRLAALLKIIPISRETADEALARGKAELDAGRGVGIFPEGQLTRTGQMQGFKRKGVETLNREHPTVPFFIDGWGSIFSFAGGRFVWKKIKRLPFRLGVRFGEALPPGASVQDLRYAVMDLGEQAMRERVESQPTLLRSFVRQAKAHWGRLALADKLDLPGGKVLSTSLSYGRALVATIMLAQSLAPKLTPAKNVAVMIPPAVGAVLSNLALLSEGKAPVNLDFVADRESDAKLQASIASLRAKLKKGEMDRIVTTRMVIKKFFIAKGRRAPEHDDALKSILTGNPDDVIFIEDELGAVQGRKLAALRTLLAARLLPTRLVERLYFSKAATDIDDTATILFTTGSTGDPKGVELTHKNLLANVEGVSQVFEIKDNDRVLNALPLFHAFGLMSGMWLPLLRGIGTVLNANPKEYKKIGDLVEEFHATIFPTVPSWLADYIREIPAEKLKTVRYAIGGGAKLWPEMAEAWQEHVGTPALEGYGATELAPVAAINVPDARDGGILQAGHKPNSVGRPVNGVTIRLVDPENPDPRKPVPAGEPGVLLVKGANVMKGYYKDEARTAEVLTKDGWYNTGDIFTMDQDGFLFFVDRNDGVAKIKGEKVPRAAVERALNDVVGLKDEDGVRKFMVVNVKDDVDGEKLIVLYKDVTQTPEELRQAMRAAHVRQLWIPNANNFFNVREFPVIGALQKPNYKAAREIAKQLLRTEGRQ